MQGAPFCNLMTRLLVAGTVLAASLISSWQLLNFWFEESFENTAHSSRHWDKAMKQEEPLTRQTLPRRLCAPASLRPSRWLAPFVHVSFTIVPPSGFAIDPQLRVSGSRRRLPFPMNYLQFPMDVLHGYADLWYDCGEAGCHATCSRSALWIGDSTRCSVFVSPYGGCVTLEQMPSGVSRASGIWERKLDWSILIYAVIGATLIWMRKDLCESPMVHCTVGAVTWLVILFFLAIWFVLKNTSRVVPFSGFLTSLTGVVMLMLPTTRWYLYQVMPSSWHLLVDVLWPIVDAVPFGRILAGVVCLCVGGWGAKFGKTWFSGFDDPDEVVEFTIGSDGRRIDMLPASPWRQQLLGLLIGVKGATLLLCSTHDVYLSAVLTLAVLLKGHVSHWVWLHLVQGDCGDPRSFRALMTVADYEEQARFNTEQALEKLRKFVSSRPKDTYYCEDGSCRLRDDSSEIRMRRFVDGGPHCRRDRTAFDDMGCSEAKAGGWRSPELRRCQIM